MPAIDREGVASPRFATTILRNWSGKTVALSRQTSAIYEIAFKLTLRSWVMAPSPWQAATEYAFVNTWHATMKGSADTWLLDNSTGAYLPGGPTQPTVRFVDDRLEFQRMATGVYSVEFRLETVL